MKPDTSFRLQLEAATKLFEDSGLGGRKIWVARDANGCLYVYSARPEWDAESGRWRGAFYGTFTHNAYPWLKPGCLVGFELHELESQPLVREADL